MSRTLVVGGSSADGLARETAALLGCDYASAEVQRQPDGELALRIDAQLADRRVAIIHSTPPQVDQRWIELLALLDAVRRGGAAEIEVAIPYCGYARSDRQTKPGQAVMLEVVAGVLESQGVDRLFTVDLHAGDPARWFGIPSTGLSAVGLLAEAVRPLARSSDVVVSPDHGGVEPAREFARLLNLSTAVATKTRTSGDSVTLRSLDGDVAGRRCIIFDDMISTGSTIAACIDALLARGAVDDTMVVTTHALLVGSAREHLRRVNAVIATNSVAPENDLVTIRVSLAPLLAEWLSDPA